MDYNHWRPDSAWPFRQEWLQIVSVAFLENSRVRTVSDRPTLMIVASVLRLHDTMWQCIQLIQSARFS